MSSMSSEIRRSKTRVMNNSNLEEMEDTLILPFMNNSLAVQSKAFLDNKSIGHLYYNSGVSKTQSAVDILKRYSVRTNRRNPPSQITGNLAAEKWVAAMTSSYLPKNATVITTTHPEPKDSNDIYTPQDLLPFTSAVLIGHNETELLSLPNLGNQMLGSPTEMVTSISGAFVVTKKDTMAMDTSEGVNPYVISNPIFNVAENAFQGYGFPQNFTNQVSFGSLLYLSSEEALIEQGIGRMNLPVMDSEDERRSVMSQFGVMSLARVANRSFMKLLTREQMYEIIAVSRGNETADRGDTIFNNPYTQYEYVYPDTFPDDINSNMQTYSGGTQYNTITYFTVDTTSNRHSYLGTGGSIICTHIASILIHDDHFEQMPLLEEYGLVATNWPQTMLKMGISPVLAGFLNLMAPPSTSSFYGVRHSDTIKEFPFLATDIAIEVADGSTVIVYRYPVIQHIFDYGGDSDYVTLSSVTESYQYPCLFTELPRILPMYQQVKNLASAFLSNEQNTAMTIQSGVRGFSNSATVFSNWTRYVFDYPGFYNDDSDFPYTILDSSFRVQDEQNITLAYDVATGVINGLNAYDTHPKYGMSKYSLKTLINDTFFVDSYHKKVEIKVEPTVDYNVPVLNSDNSGYGTYDNSVSNIMRGQSQIEVSSDEKNVLASFSRKRGIKRGVRNLRLPIPPPSKVKREAENTEIYSTGTAGIDGLHNF